MKLIFTSSWPAHLSRSSVFYDSDTSLSLLDCVLTNQQSKIQEYSPLTEFMDLDHQELRRLIALWRNQVLWGSHKAQRILCAFKAEMMRQCTSSSLSTNELILS